MDYEQKYKEALERCKKEFNFNNLTYSHEEIKQKLEFIFPELKESDDERIRKEIIHLIKKSNEYGGYALHKDEADRMINWLEKQGQKPTWSEEDKDSVDIAIRIIQNGGDDCAGILDSDKALKWLKSIKDRVQPQSKQQWSCEDENIFACLWGILNWVERSNYSSAENMRKYIKWLQSLKQRLNGYE